MAKLFGRTCTLVLGTTEIKLARPIDSANLAAGPAAQGGLALTFKVKKNLKPEPNSVEIKVWNLAPFTRLLLEQTKTIPVSLEVGYGGDNHRIYLGEVRSALSEIDGPNIITTISSGDSEKAFGPGRALFNVPAQATPQQIFNKAVSLLPIGAGNLAQAQALATAGTGGSARTYHGCTATVMGKVARSNGMEWSVQDGAFQAMKIGGIIGNPSTCPVLSASTGMVGSPTVDNKGIMKVKSLIQPGLMPGQPVVINSATHAGNFRIEDAEFNGATWGPDWTVSLTCRKW